MRFSSSFFCCILTKGRIDVYNKVEIEIYHKRGELNHASVALQASVVIKKQWFKDEAIILHLLEARFVVRSRVHRGRAV